MTDPYRPPDSQLANGPSYRLYSANSVAIATVMGSMFAGIFLIFLNYRELGRGDLGRKVAIIGVIVQIALLAVASIVEANNTLGLMFTIAQTALAFAAAHYLQASALRYHVEHGGKLHSPWRALLMGLMVGMALVFVLMLVVLATGGSAPVQ